MQIIEGHMNSERAWHITGYLNVRVTLLYRKLRIDYLHSHDHILKLIETSAYWVRIAHDCIQQRMYVYAGSVWLTCCKNYTYSRQVLKYV